MTTSREVRIGISLLGTRVDLGSGALLLYPAKETLTVRDGRVEFVKAELSAARALSKDFDYAAFLGDAMRRLVEHRTVAIQKRTHRDLDLRQGYLVGGWTGVSLEDINGDAQALLQDGTPREDGRVQVMKLQPGRAYPGSDAWVNDPTQVPAFMVFSSLAFTGRPRLDYAWLLHETNRNRALKHLLIGPQLILPEAFPA